MSFHLKVCLGLAALVAAACAAVWLLSGGGEEAAIERLFEEAARAAERGDAEGVIAIVSKDYKAAGQDYEGVARMIRQYVGPGIRYGPIEVRSAIHVRGEEADATARVRAGIGKNAQEAVFRVKLRKEEAGWRVVFAEER